MSRIALVLALALLPIPVAVADHVEPIGEISTCMWNHDLLPDQYVAYDGFVKLTVGVQFVDGWMCGIQIVCGGEINGRQFICVFPRIP